MTRQSQTALKCPDFFLTQEQEVLDIICFIKLHMLNPFLLNCIKHSKFVVVKRVTILAENSLWRKSSYNHIKPGRWEYHRSITRIGDSFIVIIFIIVVFVIIIRTQGSVWPLAGKYWICGVFFIWMIIWAKQLYDSCSPMTNIWSPHFFTQVISRGYSSCDLKHLEVLLVHDIRGIGGCVVHSVYLPVLLTFPSTCNDMGADLSF